MKLFSNRLICLLLKHSLKFNFETNFKCVKQKLNNIQQLKVKVGYFTLKSDQIKRKLSEVLLF